MLVMILNDGETFTDLSDCTIAQVPEDCDEVKGMGYKVLAEFGSTQDDDIVIYTYPHRKQTVVFQRTLSKGT